MKCDVLLLIPPVYLYGRPSEHDPKEPFGLMYLATLLREKNISTYILHADMIGMDAYSTSLAIEYSGCKILGISLTQRAIHGTKAILEHLSKGLKNAMPYICLGGCTPTISPEEVLDSLPEVDSVLRGEGEYIFAELCEKILNNQSWSEVPNLVYRSKKGYVHNSTERLRNIDSIPWPVRDLAQPIVNLTGYSCIISSRGCYNCCTFCTNIQLARAQDGKGWRGRDPIDVVDELEYLTKNFKTKVIKFQDDNAVGPKGIGTERMYKICSELRKRNLGLHLMAYCRVNDVSIDLMQEMRASGFERILLGVETTIDETLRKFGKRVTFKEIKNATTVLKKCDISLIPGFMLFNPYTTTNTIKLDLDFLKSIKGFGVSLTKCLKIHQGTPIQKIIDQEGKLLPKSLLEGYHDYIVDQKVANIYEASKLLYQNWLDPIESCTHGLVNAAKRSDTFSYRKDYDELRRSIWNATASFILDCTLWVTKLPSDIVIKNSLSKTWLLLEEYFKIINNWSKVNPERVSSALRRFAIIDTNESDGVAKIVDCNDCKIYHVPIEVTFVIPYQNLPDDAIIDQLTMENVEHPTVLLHKLKLVLGQAWSPIFTWPHFISVNELAEKIFNSLSKDCNPPILDEKYRWSEV